MAKKISLIEKPSRPVKKIDLNLARRVLAVVDEGLVCGVGEPIPGKMCVEAAVCYAQGLEHSDDPVCVDSDVRQFKIDINDDGGFATDQERAKALRELSIAQLGSNKCKGDFGLILREVIIRGFLQDKKNGVSNIVNFIDNVRDSTSTSDIVRYFINDRDVDEIINFGIKALREMKSPGIKLMEKLIPSSKKMGK